MKKPAPYQPTTDATAIILAERLSHLSFPPLRSECRSWSGRVINRDRSSLVSGYTCNINGLDFVRTPSAVIHSGDKIFILPADAGG